jgi:hypothetical protein
MITGSVERLGPLPDDWFGPQARSAILADAARDILQQADAENAAAFGGAPAEQTLVDGAATDDVALVRPEGEIVRIYDVMPAVLSQIGDWLWQHSPVRTGRYQHSHILLADGVQIAEISGADWQLPAQLPQARTFTFVSTAFYAPLIEPHDGGGGESRQAPDGVYHVIAALALDAFGALAAIAFGALGDEPAITVEPV